MNRIKHAILMEICWKLQVCYDINQPSTAWFYSFFFLIADNIYEKNM